MTRIEEIEQIKAEINRLTKRLKVLEALPEPIEERMLSSFEDFPHIERSLSYNRINTVGDLISSSPEELIRMRNIGIKKLAKIRTWMYKHKLDFV